MREVGKVSLFENNAIYLGNHEIYLKTIQSTMFVVFYTRKMYVSVTHSYSMNVQICTISTIPVENLVGPDKKQVFGGVEAGTNGGMKYSAVGAWRFSPQAGCQA